ncbi:MAG: hypothetical protein J3R72DRAFT_429495 [Linnemannia gamsii]|nr:MAG: hypothetical protein J3R72DRAFT_429495 [Linnemannia gamsii]
MIHSLFFSPFSMVLSKMPCLLHGLTTSIPSILFSFTDSYSLEHKGHTPTPSAMHDRIGILLLFRVVFSPSKLTSLWCCSFHSFRYANDLCFIYFCPLSSIKRGLQCKNRQTVSSSNEGFRPFSLLF